MILIHSRQRMKVELIIPIASLSGKLNAKANYYFRTLNGRTFVQRCPMSNSSPSAAQKAACDLFAKRARMVAKMQNEGSKLTQKELWKLAEKAL